MIKEIIFFSFGDSTKLSTWSNVPYLFSKELENRGIIVRRINLEPCQKIRNRYNTYICKIYNKIWPNNVYHYERSKLFSIITNKKIKKAVKQYKNADLCIFCTFSFYNKYNTIPSLLLCDWTFNILIQERLKRIPYYIEKKFIKRENIAIRNARFVISLFPECAKRIKEDNPTANIFYIGSNVVNSVYKGTIDKERITLEKKDSHKLLFIGNQNNPSYLKTAQLIAKAFFIAKEMDTNLELHIIGIEPSLLGYNDVDIHCYGYLHKDNEEECAIYYNTILESSLIINITPQWAGYSSLIEAMYYYTPVLVSPFKDFVKEFGANITFGGYCSTTEPKDIANNIIKILASDEYVQMSQDAHFATRNYTWGNYVDKILKIINPQSDEKVMMQDKK